MRKEKILLNARETPNETESFEYSIDNNKRKFIVTPKYSDDSGKCIYAILLELMLKKESGN